jgi:hypothetical protein
MGFVLRHIIDDIAVALKQTSDDKSIQRSQIAYWVLLIGNTLKAQHIQKRSSGAFLSIFPDIPVLMDTVNGGKNKIKNRKYIEIPTTIYDFNNDRGIDFIAYESPGGPTCPPQFTMQTFDRTTPKESEVMYYSKYTTPSPKVPAFYRVGERIYLLGIEKVDTKFVEIGLFTAFDPLTKINIDEYFDFPDELTSVLRRQVLDMARFSYIFPQERQNDGDDTIAQKTVQSPKMVSVNEQQQQTEQ